MGKLQSSLYLIGVTSSTASPSGRIASQNLEEFDPCPPRESDVDDRVEEGVYSHTVVTHQDESLRFRGTHEVKEKFVKCFARPEHQQSVYKYLLRVTNQVNKC